MATVASPKAARAIWRSGEWTTGPARFAPAVATTVAVAALLALVYRPWFLNYDARYALLWARDLANGHAPEYTAAFAPTPHPLQTAFSLLVLPFGDASDNLLVVAVLLSFGALVYLAYALGAELFSPWVGLVAALVVLTRPAMERDAVLAYQDVPFAALIVGATLLEARRPRRGAAVLVVLAFAGLLRPEAWVLAGLYWLWLWPATTWPQRARLALLVVAAPLIWAGSDWAVTGDPLHSPHGTADLAIANDRRRTLPAAPYWTGKYLGYALREPLVIGVPIGLVFAWRHARHQALLPLAVVGAMLAVFLAGPIFGLPLIRRYVEAPAVLLSLFYGLAVVGWTLLPRGSGRRRHWVITGAVAALLSVAYLPWHVDLLKTVDRRLDSDGAMYADLQTAMRAPMVKAAFSRCGHLTAGDHRPMPFARFWIGGPPKTVGTAEGGRPVRDMLLLPRRGPTTRRIYHARTFPKVQPPAGWPSIYANRSWRVYAAPRCT
jgi:hypothetical protein